LAKEFVASGKKRTAYAAAEEAFELLKHGFGQVKNITAYYGRAQKN